MTTDEEPSDARHTGLVVVAAVTTAEAAVAFPVRASQADVRA